MKMFIKFTVKEIAQHTSVTSNRFNFWQNNSILGREKSVHCC